jgi:hypothetical protein
VELLTFLKGQIFAYDLAFALIAASFLIWYSVAAANAFGEKMSYVEEQNRASEVAQSAISQLCESPGDPTNWNDFSAHSIGLIESSGVLDEAKVKRFVELASSEEGQETARAMLSLNRQGGAYLFNFKVSDSSQTELYAAGEKDPVGSSVAVASRSMLMEGRIVHIALKVWNIEGDK